MILVTGSRYALLSLHVPNHGVATSTKDGLDACNVTSGIGPGAFEKIIFWAINP
ncbi:hypothetical protein SRABI05_01530 [Agrobacterium fabrum]|nr:hypothetical protein SRABI46_00632 [Agrobacterium fabrum]CAH0192015.1 hypothetical protein SRABI05_01530 [Agrobacterium fabrum]